MNKYILIILLLFNYACEKNSYIRKYTLTKPSKSSDVDKTSFKTINKKFSWKAPMNWIEVEKSSMRIGSYKKKLSAEKELNRLKSRLGIYDSIIIKVQ